MTTTKLCKDCFRDLPLADYHRDPSKKFGVATYCKPCAIKRAGVWYRSHEGKVKAARKAEYAADPEAIKARVKRYVSENPEKVSALQKRWRKLNADKKRVADIEWQEKNRDKQRLYRIVSQARRRDRPGKFTAADVADKVEAQRGRCAICKVSLKKGRHVDHIVPLSRGGENVSSNLQILCPPCNMKKSAKIPEDFMRELGFLL